MAEPTEKDIALAKAILSGIAHYFEFRQLPNTTKAVSEAIAAHVAEAVKEKDAENERLREVLVVARRALSDVLTGVSVHNDRLREGQLAQRIEGPVITQAINAYDRIRKALEQVTP
jgi:hypothetical protein